MSGVFPSFKEFRPPYSGEYSVVVKKGAFWAPPFEVYRAYSGKGRVLLESARAGGVTGRYSFFARKPFLTFEVRTGRAFLGTGREVKAVAERPLVLLKKILAERRIENTGGLPPFCGGAVGYFGYEARRVFDPKLRSKPKNGGPLVPEICLLFFDEGVVFDHAKKETVLVRHFIVGRDAKKSHDTAVRALERAERDIQRRLGSQKVRPTREYFRPPSPDRIRVSTDRASFCQMVKAAKGWIKKGDIYQANLSHRLSFPVRQKAEEIYQILRCINPSPFFGLMDAGPFQILSGSPERLIRLEGRRLDTRPIAGTRPRKKGIADAASAVELVLNEKERAEHLMLLDLERNDLGRVAEYGSVTVDELMTVEEYSHVRHIVSNVCATLREGLDAVDVLKAFFPGGTITGAPKIRCMEIIDELEHEPRGPYTGSLGYISFTGDMDFNIIIRSLVLEHGKAHLNVGAGIVADSDPDREYDETLYKAEAVLKAVFGKEGTRRFFGSCGPRSRMPG